MSARNAGTLHPRHVVLATGHAGEPYIPPSINLDAFEGDRLIHSSQFTESSTDGKGTKAVVVPLTTLCEITAITATRLQWYNGVARSCTDARRSSM